MGKKNDKLLINHPFTGECFDRSNIDELINAYDAYSLAKKEIDNFGGIIRTAMLELTADLPADQATRRLMGDERKAKLELADFRWDYKILFEAWSGFPKVAPSYLTLTQGIKPQLREVKKLIDLSENKQISKGSADVNSFAKILISANRGREGLPKITIEK